LKPAGIGGQGRLHHAQRRPVNPLSPIPCKFRIAPLPTAFSPFSLCFCQQGFNQGNTVAIVAGTYTWARDCYSALLQNPSLFQNLFPRISDSTSGLLRKASEFHVAKPYLRKVVDRDFVVVILFVSQYSLNRRTE
jgi:hypothetical protein